MARLTNHIDWLEPDSISPELQDAIDETNRRIRECFLQSKRIKASLHSVGRPASPKQETNASKGGLTE